MTDKGKPVEKQGRKATDLKCNTWWLGCLDIAMFKEEKQVKEVIQESQDQLDKEWVQLITLAKEMGLTKEEVQTFLRTKLASAAIHITEE